MNNADKPAMAQPVTSDENGEITITADYDTDYMGLTKREHFAGLAMQGLIAQSYGPRTVKEIAFESLAMADALLKELEQDNE